MVALQIRDVPDDVRSVLAARAAELGQLLQAFLLMLVTDEARRAANLAILERFAGRSDGSAAPSASGAWAVDVARSERDDAP